MFKLSRYHQRNQKNTYTLLLISSLAVSSLVVIFSYVELHQMVYRANLPEDQLQNELLLINLGIVLMIVTLYSLSFFISRQITQRFYQKDSVFLSHIIGMVNAINARDNYTKIHSINVANYATELAKKWGMPRHKLLRFYEAVVLHDVGKIGIGDDVLKKVDRLTAEEFEEMKKHTIIGEQIVSHIEELKEFLPVIRHHHERIDGKGYPDQLKGDEIHPYARIVAVCDAFDAMTTTRPYRRYMYLEEAIAELQNVKGSQLDPVLVDQFAEIFNIHPVIEKWLQSHGYIEESSELKLSHPAYSYVKETFTCTAWVENRFYRITLRHQKNHQWYVESVKNTSITDVKKEFTSDRQYIHL